MYCWPVAFSQRLPQHRYVVIQVVFLDRRLWPYRVQQLLLRDQPPGVLDQHKERVEHLQTERITSPPAREPALTNVEMETARTDTRFGTAVFATNHTSGKFQEYASVLKGRQRPLDSSLSIARTETAKKAHGNAQTASRPEFLPSPTMAMQAPAETLAWRFNPTWRQRRPCCAGRRSRIAGIRRSDRACRHARRRRRAASLRLCVQLVFVPELAAPAYAAALSRGARHAIVANPHPRHRV